MVDRLREGGWTEPVAIAADHVAEASQPALVVDMVISVGPRPELLAVVATNNRSAWMLGGDPAEFRVAFMRIAKRDQIAEPLGAGENFEEVAFVLGQIVAEELVRSEPGAFEMKVVKNRVFDSSLGQ